MSYEDSQEMKEAPIRIVHPNLIPEGGKPEDVPLEPWEIIAMEDIPASPKLDGQIIAPGLMSFDDQNAQVLNNGYSGPGQEKRDARIAQAIVNFTQQGPPKRPMLDTLSRVAQKIFSRNDERPVEMPKLFETSSSKV